MQMHPKNEVTSYSAKNRDITSLVCLFYQGNGTTFTLKKMDDYRSSNLQTTKYLKQENTRMILVG